MRSIQRFLPFFITALIVLLSQGIIANDEQLVEADIPSLDEVVGNNALPMYLTPSLQTVNAATQTSNSLCRKLETLDIKGKLLTDKKSAAYTAAFGGLTWKYKLSVISASAATKSYSAPLKEFIKELLNISGQIDREQEYAIACQAMNAHYVTTNNAKIMAESMHPIATILRDRYKAQNTSTTGLFAFDPLPNVEIPEPETPLWYCKANEIGSGLHSSLRTCDDTFDTPYKARDTHKLACGSSDDPKPNVNGCGSSYYTCDDRLLSYHKVRTCNKWIWEKPSGTLNAYKSYKCGREYRKCVLQSFDHNPFIIGSTSHSDAANDDDTTAEEPQTPEQPAMHPCSYHEITVSGNHSWTTPPCGVSNHANFACRIGSDHQQMQCTSTNANGDQCTYTYWQCLNDSTPSHNHVYPAPVAVSCGRSGCTQTVSSSTEHQVTCSAGHQYWSCGQYANWLFHQHRVVTCKFTSCQQTWQKCTGGAPMCRAASRQGNRCWGLPASP